MRPAEELEALLAIHSTGLIGTALYRRLLQRLGSAAAALAAPDPELQKVHGIGPQTAKAIREARESRAGAKEIEDARKSRTRLLVFDDPAYPAALRATFDHPLVLYVRGELKAQDAMAIGVVGARKCSDYGRRQATRFGRDLAKLGITLVSGLARGIDAAAHEGALQVPGGRTLAVLGSGLLKIYPPEHRGLYDRIAERGAVLSEFPLHMPPAPEYFPRRNRIISGLSAGVLVVEASMKSGALITADWALEQNREVFCVPGAIENPLSSGCHFLIQQGAKLVQDVEDLLTELPQFRPLLDKLEREPSLSPTERPVYRLLGDEPVDEETLRIRTRLPSSAVDAALGRLVSRGLARSEKGGYVRVKAQA